MSPTCSTMSVIISGGHRTSSGPIARWSSGRVASSSGVSAARGRRKTAWRRSATACASHQGRGYATEAVMALVTAAWRRGGVRAITPRLNRGEVALSAGIGEGELGLDDDSRVQGRRYPGLCDQLLSADIDRRTPEPSPSVCRRGRSTGLSKANSVLDMIAANRAREFLEMSKRVPKDKRIALLKSVDLLSGCNKNELQQIASQVTELDVPAGRYRRTGNAGAGVLHHRRGQGHGFEERASS